MASAGRRRAVREIASRSALVFLPSSSRRLLPGVGDRRHQLPEVRLREVGAAVERLAVGGEEHRHRPAAAPGHRLHGVHVHGVDVGALLAVDLDVDEPGVHVGGDLGVLEALVGHHMAPVARRVADRQQHRHVALAGLGERLRSPRVPVDRVVAVLAEVRRGLAGEPVHIPDATQRFCKAVGSVTAPAIDRAFPAADRRAGRRRRVGDRRARAGAARRHDLRRRPRGRRRLGGAGRRRRRAAAGDDGRSRRLRRGRRDRHRRCPHGRRLGTGVARPARRRRPGRARRDRRGGRQPGEPARRRGREHRRVHPRQTAHRQRRTCARSPTAWRRCPPSCASSAPSCSPPRTSWRRSTRRWPSWRRRSATIADHLASLEPTIDELSATADRLAERVDDAKGRVRIDLWLARLAVVLIGVILAIGLLLAARRPREPGPSVS